MDKKNVKTEEKIEILSDRMAKLIFTKPYSANRNHVNKIAAQMRYLEKLIRPEVKETAN